MTDGPQDDSEPLGRRLLLAQRDAARREGIIREMRGELAKAELKLLHSGLESAEYLRQIGRLEDRLAALHGSASWRWSAPVRRFAAVSDRLRAALGGPPPAVEPGPPPPADPVPAAPDAMSLRETMILQRLQRQG